MPHFLYSTRYGLRGAQPNLLVRIAAGVGSALVLIASAFLGLFIFLAVLGLLAFGGAVMAVRVWIFRRRVAAALRWGATQDPRTRRAIDTEYEER